MEEKDYDRLKSAQRYAVSWSFAMPGFEQVLAELRESLPERTGSAGLIKVSSGKFVWHLQHRSTDRNFDFAYKIQVCKTPWRYLFRFSKPVREVRKYLMLDSIGIPVPKVLAVGEVRRFFVLRESYMMTGFFENSSDGRLFMHGGKSRLDTERKLAYCRAHLELLARVHEHGICHGAFHPRNLLWRDGARGMEVFWVDVARCRKVSPGRLARAAVVDLHTFFQDLQLRRSEVKPLLEHYLASFRQPVAGLPAEADGLMTALENFRRNLFSRKQYVLFDPE